MNLDTALSIASGGLANIDYRLGVVSNNVANAATPDYTTEVANQQSLVAGSQGVGVRSEATTRAIDQALQDAAFQQDTTVAGLTTQNTALNAIDAVLGTPGQGNDLGGLLGAVQSAFSTLQTDPSSAPQQAAVVNAAGNLTNAINAISTAYTQQRQAAQSDIVSQTATLNTSLQQIGAISARIVGARVAGQSTADLENQRDAIVHTLSGIMSVKTLTQPNGDLIVTTAAGTQLPTRGQFPAIQTSNASIGPGASYPANGIPAITLGGVDITSQIQGGRLGADLTLRDNTLPTFQGELDEFSASLANRFSAQGLTLFSDPQGNVPAMGGGGTPVQAGYVGFSSQIQVNPAVQANVSLVRDGTNDIAGSPTGASAFTVNPPGGPAGFGTLIGRILTYALGGQAQPGVPQPATSTTGLGPDGTLNAPYAAPATLADNAAAVVSSQSGVSTAVTGQLQTETTVQTTLNNTLSTSSGVNMDTQMSQMIQLQNAYSANARIVTAVQAMFSSLIASVQ